MQRHHGIDPRGAPRGQESSQRRDGSTSTIAIAKVGTSLGARPKSTVLTSRSDGESTQTQPKRDADADEPHRLAEHHADDASRRWAPSAMRMPISFVRRATL